MWAVGSASAANQVDYLESFQHLNNRPLTVGLCICGTRTSGWWWTSSSRFLLTYGTCSGFLVLS